MQSLSTNSSHYIQQIPVELMKVQVIKLSSQISKTKLENVISSDDRQKLYEVKEFIEQNFLQEQTVTGLCRHVGLNEFKLKKGFKALFGTPVIQYVRRLRMEYARELIRDNCASIQEISALLGYHYANHFSTAYKRHFGITPVTENKV